MRGGPPDDDEGPLKALKAFGATAEQLAQAKEELQQRQGDEIVWVFPCNWTAVNAFLELSGSWRWRPDGTRDGLEHSEIKATLSLMGTNRSRRPAQFRRIKVMESEALRAMR